MKFPDVAGQNVGHSNTTSCCSCPLRKHSIFRPHGNDLLDLVKSCQVGEMRIAAGTVLFTQDARLQRMYSVLEGFGLRKRSPANGELKAISFLLPGDFIGLQRDQGHGISFGVEVTSDMMFCVFDRADMHAGLRKNPDRLQELTWQAAREENLLAEVLSVNAQLSGTQTIAWALLLLFRHLKAMGVGGQDVVPLPYRQKDLAEALGLSLVHANKTLARLRKQGLIDWRDGLLHIPSLKEVADFIDVDLSQTAPRPFL